MIVHPSRGHDPEMLRRVIAAAANRPLPPRRPATAAEIAAAGRAADEIPRTPVDAGPPPVSPPPVRSQPVSIDFAAIKAANAAVSAAPDVRKMADGLGVDLRTVQPRPGQTAVDIDDVKAAYGRRTSASRRGNPTPPNAAAAGPYTGSDGTLPAFTASGLDPKVLRRYPAPVRPAMAAVPSLAEAYAIGQRYVGLTDDEARQQLATDASIPTEIAYAWTDPDHVEAGGVSASQTYQPDTTFASAEQIRIDGEHRHRARMKAEAEARGDFYTYRNW
ncbi:hypothetical protein AB0873_09510 [Micromonospora sp. NPDC047707]|uniref:hypothetical protein n=1 Tax=Micromonospora sp. NPDC047707 TaxID=3154498 RepID=UPI003454F8AA